MKRILMMALALMLCFGVFVSGVGADTEGYDDTSEIARWKKVATLPTADSQCIAAIKDKIYIMGIKSDYKDTARLNIFDLKSKKWTTGKDLIDKVRAYSAIATVDDKLYVMGGVGGDEATGMSLVQIYDPKTNTWTHGTRMPARISRAACAAVGDNIYVFGGYNSNDNSSKPKISNETFIYNTKTDSWRTGPNSLPLCDMKACAIGKKIYVMGGRSSAGSDGYSARDISVYDTETDAWGSGMSMPISGDLKAAVSVGEDIYSICSLGDNTSKQIDVYNTVTKTWSTKTKAWPRGAALPENVGETYNIFQALAINGSIYAMDSKNILSMEAAPPVKSNELSLGLDTGQSIQLNGTGDLASATGLTWTSSDSSVASVDESGKVTALKKGSTSISAKNTGGTVQQSITIEVTQPEPDKTLPVVTDVKWTETGAAVTATSDKKIAMYGVSGTKDPAAATWKKSNIFANVKIGATYYFFAKDEEGNISEPFAFKRSEE